MPSPSRLSSALQQAAPSAFKSKLEEAIAASQSSSYMPWADSDSDEEAELEAERLIESHRQKRAEAEAKEAELKAIQDEVDAQMAAIDSSVTAWLGHAGRDAALKKAMAKREAALGNKLNSIAEAALAAARAQVTVCASVLTDGDLLSIILRQFELEHLGDVPTEGGLARYCALAAVCTQWHTAISSVMQTRCVLRHASMFVDGPRSLSGFKRPSFLDITPTDELIVADNHRVTMLPLPRSLLEEEGEEEDEPKATPRGRGQQLASTSATGGRESIARAAPANGPERALRTFGNDDGSGGSSLGELCRLPGPVIFTSVEFFLLLRIPCPRHPILVNDRLSCSHPDRAALASIHFHPASPVHLPYRPPTRAGPDLR